MEKKDRFVRRAVIAALAAAVLLFAAGGAVIRSYPDIIARTAAAKAENGDYDGAMRTLADLDAQLYPDAVSDGTYRVAQAMLDNGEYTSARELFIGLDGYENSADMALECQLRYARELTERKDYAEASDILMNMLYYSDAKQAYYECRYLGAKDEYEKGNWLIAVQMLWNVRDYADAAKLASEITLEATGSSDVEAALGDAADYSAEELQLVSALAAERETLRDGAIAVGFRHTVGLRADGTVAACGDNSLGQCDVGGWKNVVSIAATDYDTVALLADGTVVTCGYHDFFAAAGWYDVSRIFTGTYSVGCLYSGGYLLSTNESGRNIDGIYTSAAASTAYVLALDPRGTVRTDAGIGERWENVLSVYASPTAAGAITAGGAADIEFFRDGQTPSLPEGRAVSMALGGTHYAVLYEDGTVFAFGSNDCGQCDTGDWMLG